MSERQLKPTSIPMPFQVTDTLMRPLMHTLGGFKPDSLQETHPWHVQEIDHELIDPELTVTIKGSASESMKSHNVFLFHAPILGGWRNYTLFETAQAEFHIGWVGKVRGKLAQAAINRLLIFDGKVRMLNGPEGSETDFFAVDPDGIQIGIQSIGGGKLGDNQFPGTRLL
jgi:hypothetical protein